MCAAAMGRCQSTPGLVESRGRIPLEEMLVSPLGDARAGTRSLGHSVFSPSPSPLGPVGCTPGRGIQPPSGPTTPAYNAGADSPVSSGHSSDDGTARVPRSNTQPSTARQSTHSGQSFFSCINNSSL